MFKSTTREQWASARESKTKPPDVGKYNPRFKHLDADQKKVAIPVEHKHLGSMRIAEKEEQQTNVCLKSFKDMNHKVNDSQYDQKCRTLAQYNQGIVEREREEEAKQRNQDGASLLGFEKVHLGSEQDEEKKLAKPKPLDCFHFYVKEFREPKYRTSTAKEPNSPPKPCEKYNVSYLPNGQQVENLHYDDLQRAHRMLNMQGFL
jgi:hypothetical protein